MRPSSSSDSSKPLQLPRHLSSPKASQVLGRTRARRTARTVLPSGWLKSSSVTAARQRFGMSLRSAVNDRAQFCPSASSGAKFAKGVGASPHPACRPSTSATRACARIHGGTGHRYHATPQNETSTGVAITERIAGADEGALLLVDATSAAGGLPIDITQTDAYYFAPQKNFASDGGIWFSLMSPAAIERAAEIEASDRWIPDQTQLADRDRQLPVGSDLQHPGTPTLFLMAEQIDWFNENGGLDWTTARTAASAANLYGWAEKTSLHDALCHRSQSVQPSSGPSILMTRSTPPSSRRHCEPTGSSTPSRTASSDATSCESPVPRDRGERHHGVDELYRVGRQASPADDADR